MTDKKEIARKYLKSWFVMDLLSIFPFDYILDAANINQFARVLRFGKLYKLVRMTRMVRFLKLLKDRNRISSNLDRILKISAGFERLHFFLLILVLYLHVTACLFVLSAQFNTNANWV